MGEGGAALVYRTSESAVALAAQGGRQEAAMLLIAALLVYCKLKDRERLSRRKRQLKQPAPAAVWASRGRPPLRSPGSGAG